MHSGYPFFAILTVALTLPTSLSFVLGDEVHDETSVKYFRARSQDETLIHTAFRPKSRVKCTKDQDRSSQCYALGRPTVNSEFARLL